MMVKRLVQEPVYSKLTGVVPLSSRNLRIFLKFREVYLVEILGKLGRCCH